MLPKGTVFVAFCIILRIVMAFGGAAADTASFAIVAGEFGSSLGTVMVKCLSNIINHLTPSPWVIQSCNF